MYRLLPAGYTYIPAQILLYSIPVKTSKESSRVCNSNFKGKKERKKIARIIFSTGWKSKKREDDGIGWIFLKF